jgi:hypothetical protein
MEKDMVNVQVTAWMRHDPLHRTNFIRIELTLALHLFCFSGARIGALFPADDDKARGSKGLRYKVR